MQYQDRNGNTITKGRKFYHKNHLYPAKWWDTDGTSNLEKMGFTPMPEEATPKKPPVDPLTIALDKRRLRHGLLQLGITAEMVVAAIKSEDDPVKRETALIEWDEAGFYHFNHPLVQLLIVRLELSNEVAAAKWAEMVGVG